MVIRKAVKGDLQSLSELFEDYRKFYKKEADPDAAKIFLEARIANNDAEIFVAEDDQRLLVGFVQLYPLFSSTRMKRLWLLNDLFVLPGQRGKGISIALINECKNLCRQTNSCGMMLETAKDNTIGNQLYQKTGFALDYDHNYYEWENE